MRQNNESSFSSCYRKTSPTVYSIILRIISSPSVAEDLMQESFIQAFNNLSQLKDDNKFFPWLKKIAFNKTMNFIRSKKSTEEFEEEKHSESSTYAFSEELINQNQLAFLLAQISKEERLVLWLFSVEGYSHKEIAQMMDKTISYSKSIVFRSLTKLRKENETFNEVK
jgi:RNA polymerase sigma-70 factor (ECF subfamily)